MNEFLYWLRAKLDIWLMRFDDAFDVDWGDDDDPGSEPQDSES